MRLKIWLRERFQRDCFLEENDAKNLDLHCVLLDTSTALGLLLWRKTKLHKVHPDNHVVGIIVTGKGNCVNLHCEQGVLQIQIGIFICEQLGLEPPLSP